MKQNTQILTRSHDRFHTKIDWLDSRHSFSFGQHYDPENLGFGPLRVVNDDIIAPGGGFAPHPHRDMEIVTILLDGQLEHKDSLGNGRVIEPGEIQYMSAGTGVVHSEFNPSQSKPAHLLQIWIEPTEKGLPPTYEDRKLLSPKADQWRLILSEDGRDHSMKIRRDAELRSTTISPGHSLPLPFNPQLPAHWIFVIKGSVSIEGEVLETGDSLGINTGKNLLIESTANRESEIIVFSLPH